MNGTWMVGTITMTPTGGWRLQCGVSKKRPRTDAELTLQGQGSKKQASVVCVVKAARHVAVCGLLMYVYINDACNFIFTHQ